MSVNTAAASRVVSRASSRFHREKRVNSLAVTSPDGMARLMKSFSERNGVLIDAAKLKLD